MNQWRQDIVSWAKKAGRDPDEVEGILIKGHKGVGWDPKTYQPSMKNDLYHYLQQWYTLSVKKLPIPATAVRKNPISSKNDVLRLIKKEVNDEEGELHHFVSHYWDYLKAQGIKLDRILGCGTFGCAFETQDTNVIAKLTFDNHEINLFEKLASLKAPLPGIADIYEIIPMQGVPIPEEDGYTLDYFLVFREAVDPLKDKKIKDKIARVAYLYNAAHNPNWIEYDVPSVFETLSNEEFDFLRSFIDTLKFLSDRDIVISDIRPPNVGYSRLTGELVLFDAQL